MTKPLPFTKASIVRRCLGAKEAGLYVVGLKPDGTLITAEKPIDLASFIPPNAQPSPPAETRRMGDYFNGDQGEA